MKFFVIASFLIVASLLTTTASAQIPPPTTEVSLHSAPGDPWSVHTGQSDWLYHPSDARFLFYGAGRAEEGVSQIQVIIHSNNNQFWALVFNNGPARPFTVGRYETATVGPYPDLDISGLGGSCYPRAGRFEIFDLAVDYQPSFGYTLTRFAASFEYHCYGLTPALTGKIYFNSNGHSPPPKLLMKDRAPLSEATVGDQYSERVEVEGGAPPYNWTLDPAPPGLSIDSSGVIGGAPTAVGKYVFTVHVVDSSVEFTGYPVQLVSKQFSITVNAAVFRISDGLPPTSIKDNGYAYQFAARGGQPPYLWSVIDGKIPQGLILNNEGKLSGIPQQVGTFNFRLRATDSSGQQSEQQYAIRVIDPPRIDFAKYKVNKGKLIIAGVKFDEMATLFIDGEKVEPKSRDGENIVVKALSLATGTHEVRVVNRDGGTASVTITVQ